MIKEKAYNACTILKHGGGIHIPHGNDAGYIRKDTLFLKGVHKSFHFKLQHNFFGQILQC